MGPQRPSEGRNVPNSSGVAARRSAGLVPNRWKCPARGKCLLYNDGLKRYSFWIFDLWAFLGVSICEIERYTVYIYIHRNTLIFQVAYLFGNRGRSLPVYQVGTWFQI